MKKLLIAATLTAAALAATPLLADQKDHQHGQRGANTAQGCTMAGEHGQGREHAAQQEQRHAEMQKRMQEMHARMGSHEDRGQGRGTQGEHQH